VLFALDKTLKLAKELLDGGHVDGMMRNKKD
jgi:hypothetical protein